ncbi:MAG: hypothetical protein U0353_32800 [Sandaracinus sp.]
MVASDEGAVGHGAPRSDGERERSLVTFAMSRQRRLVLLVGLPLLVALRGPLGYGSASWACTREAPGGALSCAIELHTLLDHTSETVRLQDPLITVLESGNSETAETELRVEDASTRVMVTGTGTLGSVRALADGLRACTEDPSRLRCEGVRSNLAPSVCVSLVMSLLCLAFGLAASATRTTLIADRERRELRVHRRLLGFPRAPMALAARSLHLELSERKDNRGFRVILVADSTRVGVAVGATRLDAEQRLAEILALLDWLRVEPPTPDGPIADPPVVTGWDATSGTLREGPLPLPRNLDAARRQQRLAIVVLALACGSGVLGASWLGSYGLTLGFVGLFVLLAVPAAYLVSRLGMIDRERQRAALVIEREGVRHTREGEHRLVRWTEMAQVEQNAWGRFVFRDATGAALLVFDAYGNDDERIAHAMIATARKAVAASKGLEPTSEARGGIFLALLFGWMCLGLALVLVVPWGLDGAPARSELEHRHGTVARFDRTMSSGGTVSFELTNDDLAFYVVRDREHAERVLARLRIGDDVDLWHDRATRPSGTIGAVYEMSVEGDALFTIEGDARREDARIRVRSVWAGAICLVGALLIALGLLPRRRYAIVPSTHA